MSICKGYKFEKGEFLKSSSSGDGEEHRYRLHITDNKGTLIAEVDPSSAQYIFKVSGHHRNKIDESLRVEGRPMDYDIEDFFIKFENGKFILTGKSINTRVKIDSFTLTDDGKELLSECSPNSVEYHVPTHDHADQNDHSFDHDGIYNGPSAPEFDLL